MGLFTPGPRFDDEAPGLPGEPLVPESVAERLPDPAADTVGLGIADQGLGSIVIPVVIPPAEGQAADAPTED